MTSRVVPACDARSPQIVHQRRQRRAKITAPSMQLWLDTESNEFAGPLISMALVDEKGRHWYQVLPCTEPTRWIRTHVMPVLGKRPTDLRSMQRSLSRWVGAYESIHVIASWPSDFIHLCDLVILGPGVRLELPPLTMELVQDLVVESALAHNALEDAKALRRAYLARSASCRRRGRPCWT